VATIDHVTIRVAELDASRELYDSVFELLPSNGQRYESDAFVEWGDFSIAQADRENPPTRSAHIAFAAASREQIDNLWRTLTNAGHRDDGPPGPRPQYNAGYYGAFIRDLDNNSVEAVHHPATSSEPGLIDHLWIRVPDLAAAKRFYTGIAVATGLRIHHRSERLHLGADGASFALLEGEPTENLHLAIGVDTKETVAEFRSAGLAAGGRDNGPPGERPQYHPGYWGAYLLDPAGNNIEAVFHDRRS
jgi:catechol 2,3-dioxygenase-like lactoylglutathione lyase family enzyme